MNSKNTVNKGGMGPLCPPLKYAPAVVKVHLIYRTNLFIDTKIKSLIKEEVSNKGRMSQCI